MIPGRTLNTPLKAWSWSALDSYETCPKRHYELKVAKSVREKPSQELQYGRTVHQALEARLKGKAPLPDSLRALEGRVSNIERMGGALVAEQELALNDRLGLTSWFAKDAWVRMKLDWEVNFGTKLIIGDWKTGKMKDDWGQLTMAAHLKCVLQPAIQEVGLTFVWTKYDDTSKKVVTREEAALTWANEILPRVAKYQAAFDANAFPPKPSGLCRRHCPVVSCEHHGGG